MLLKQLPYPCRYNDMIHVPRFGRPVPEISMMTNAVLDWINIEDGHHLTDFNQPFLSCASLRTYANAIHQEGAVLNNFWGFIYGTVRCLLPTPKSTNCLQWPQKGTCVEIPTYCDSKWSHCQLIWPSMWVEIYLYSKSNYQIKSIVLSGVIAVFIWRKHYFWCHLLYFCVDCDMCSWCLWNDNWNDKITDKSTTGHKWKRCIRYHQFSELNDFFQISASFDKVKHVFVYFKKGYRDVNNHRQAENTPFTIGTFALERSSLPNCRLEYGNGVLSWDWIW